MTYMTGWGPHQLADRTRGIKITDWLVILFHFKKEDSLIFTLEKKETCTANIYYYDSKFTEHKDLISCGLSDLYL